MRYEVLRMPHYADTWIAQATGRDGEIFRAIFDYANAKVRAEEYAAWKNSQTISDPHTLDGCNN